MAKQEINYPAHQIMYQELKAKGLILFECISGSQAYGTNTPASDIDRKFVFCTTLDLVLVGDFPPQLFLNKDHTGFEISRFLELLQVANPSVMEMLYQTDDTIEYINPIFKEFIIDRRQDFLTKKTYFSFAEYVKNSDQESKRRK